MWRKLSAASLLAADGRFDKRFSRSLIDLLNHRPSAAVRYSGRFGRFRNAVLQIDGCQQLRSAFAKHRLTFALDPHAHSDYPIARPVRFDHWLTPRPNCLN